MRIEVQAVAPGEVDADVLAVPLAGGDGLTGAAAELDGALGGLLAQLRQVGELRSDLGTARVIHVTGQVTAQRVAEWTNRARDLVNSPPNEATPERLAARAAEIASSVAHVESEALGPEEIRGRGMGALAAVAQGSDNPPRLVVLRYEPPQPVNRDFVLGLVGKAITFDTGGISLKPSLHMQDMKGDMAGGAAVIEATGAIADLGLPVRVLTVA